MYTPSRPIEFTNILKVLSFFEDSYLLTSSRSPADAIFSSLVSSEARPEHTLKMRAQCKKFKLCSEPEVISTGFMQGGTRNFRASVLILAAHLSPSRLRPDLSH